MSQLGDTLATKEREFVLRCKITIAVDSATDAVEPTYAVLLEAPETSQTLLSAQTALQAAAALTEYTDWVVAQW